MVKLQENDVFAQHYLLQELLGFHGTSEVWKAEDLDAPGEPLALRIFAPLSALDKLTLKLLQDDFDRMAAPTHQNLLPVRHAAFYNSVPYLVMPYAPGGSLLGRLQAKQPLTEEEVALVLRQIGGALHSLHTLQPPLFHQNMSPADILLDGQGNYLLSGYGISSPARYALHRASGQPNTPATAYTPPEHITAEPRSSMAGDVFSLGVVLYELCTGQKPWLGDGGMAAATGASIAPLPERYTRALDTLLRACMAPDWEKRPSPAELEMIGTYFLQQGTWKIPNKYGKGRRFQLGAPRKGVLWTLAVLAILLVAAFLYFGRRGTSPVSGTVADSPRSDTLVQRAPLVATEDSITQQEPAAEKPAKAPDTAVERPQPKAKPAPAQPAVAAATETAPPPTEEETPPPAAAEEEQKPPQPTEPKPTDLSAYLSQLVNAAVPYLRRERLKPQVLRYFAPDAAIYYLVDNTPIGKMNADEMVDILLSADSASTVAIDSTRLTEDGKVVWLRLRMTSPPPTPPAETEEPE